MKSIWAAFSFAIALTLATATAPEAQSNRDAPQNAATDHHGLPGNNPGFGGSSANPRGGGKNDGGGIHGIGNVPGHNRDNMPGADGTPGFASQLGTVHGGLGGHGGHGGH